MKILKYGKYYIAVISCLLLISCEEFVDVDAPNHKIVSELVFEDEAMVIAAIRGIYNELANADFSKGYLYSISVLAGMSPDIFETTKDTDTRFGPFQQNELTSLASDDATANQNLWSSAYNIIYMTNSVLEGVGNSKTITKETKMMAAGQALFIRAF